MVEILSVKHHLRTKGWGKGKPNFEERGKGNGQGDF